MSVDIERKVDVAEAMIRHLDCDRDRWRVTVSGGLNDSPPSIHFHVDTRKPDDKTGLYSANLRVIWLYEFPPHEELRTTMQSMLDKMIQEIESLPPPTQEDVERLALV